MTRPVPTAVTAPACHCGVRAFPTSDRPAPSELTCPAFHSTVRPPLVVIGPPEMPAPLVVISVTVPPLPGADNAPPLRLRPEPIEVTLPACQFAEIVLALTVIPAPTDTWTKAPPEPPSSEAEGGVTAAKASFKASASSVSPDTKSVILAY